MMLDSGVAEMLVECDNDVGFRSGRDAGDGDEDIGDVRVSWIEFPGS